MGVMGCTILKGLLAAGALAPERVWGTSRSADTCREVAADLGVAVEPDVQHRLASAGVVVLCVKPAQAPVALAALAGAGLRPDALVVSIAAGVDSTQISTMLGTDNPIVRAMPNTPCVVGEGMTAICRGPRATPTHLAQARRIFECVGRAVETEEKHFNAITALSGSGPAYHYLIMEAMADAGVRVGLPRDLALALVVADHARRGADGADVGPASGGAARRRHHAGRLHHRRPADARGRQDPIGARARDRRGDADRQQARSGRPREAGRGPPLRTEIDDASTPPVHGSAASPAPSPPASS